MASISGPRKDAVTLPRWRGPNHQKAGGRKALVGMVTFFFFSCVRLPVPHTQLSCVFEAAGASADLQLCLSNDLMLSSRRSV